MSEYKILWFDDDFTEENHFYTQSLVSSLKEVASNSGCSFDVNPVCDFDTYVECLSPDKKYDVVILDLYGLNAIDKSDKSFTKKAMAKLASTKVLKYVYSQQPDDDYYDYEKDPDNPSYIPKENWLSKNAGQDATEKLAQRILRDLQSKALFYIGYEFILELYNNQWLSASKNLIDDILKKHRQGEPFQMYYNAIRETLVKGEIFEKLEIERLIPSRKDAVVDPRTYICELCRYFPNGQRNFNNPYFPYALCPSDAKASIDYLCTMGNVGSHLEYTSSDNVIISMVSEATFHTLMITLKWFYDIMIRLNNADDAILSHKNSLQSQIEEIAPKESKPLEYDEKLGIYYCGDGQVSSKLVKDAGWGTGQMLVIDKKNKNTAENSAIAEKYPFFLYVHAK
ncbi:MAG: hypothetical protein MJZ79_05040 [Paludibacteraceae bacterium]|nr:hypothetical protein [Paludibacteraceae bacterium]